MPEFLNEGQNNYDNHYQNGNGSYLVLEQKAPISFFYQEAVATAEQSDNSQSDWSPITQELAETLPRPWTRGLLHVVLGLISVGLPWSMLAKVDETGSARGRLEPEGQAVRLDAPVAGTVVDVNVKEGQTVTGGEVIVELESNLTRSELQQAQEVLEGQQNRLTQLELMQNQLRIAIGEQRLQNQALQSAQLAQFDQAQEQLTAAQRASNLARTNLEREQGEVERFESLRSEGIISAVQVIEAQRIRDRSMQEFSTAQSEVAQAQFELEKQQSNYDEVRQRGELVILQTQQQLKELETSIVSIRAEIAQTQNQIKSLELQLEQRVLRSPTDGTVFQLQVQHPGAVVQTSQEIVQIAPAGTPLVFRAQMPSQETGFLKIDAPVKLKFDAYPFQDYGIISGRVRWIAPNSKIVETPEGNIEVFEIEVVLEQSIIHGQDQTVVLNAGQTATAEVIIRQRRVIDFILDPFRRLQQSGLEL
jgi:HlyD family secretion protein